MQRFRRLTTNFPSENVKSVEKLILMNRGIMFHKIKTRLIDVGCHICVRRLQGIQGRLGRANKIIKGKRNLRNIIINILDN